MSVDKNEKRIGNGDDGFLYLLLLQVKLIEGSVLQRIDVLPAAT